MVNTKHPDVIGPSARGQPMGKWIFGILVVLAGVTVACGGRVKQPGFQTQRRL